jgi:8-oxo-dGTP pyrophosphatase MutT (NUDIX family)
VTEPKLPGWWEPLLTRVNEARTVDFTRFPVPDTGGRDAAVLILLADGDEGPDVLILERASTMRQHAGQPAFPGGAADPGDDGAVGTALREANEEVGLDPASVTIVAELPRLWIPVSDFIVTPVLGWWHEPHPVGPVSLGEVARVARLSIADLVNPDNRCRCRHPSGWIGPAFEAGDMFVWGFTAGVLTTLLEMAGWARPWDTSRIKPLPVG